jgi:hypothetical protein
VIPIVLDDDRSDDYPLTVVVAFQAILENAA